MSRRLCLTSTLLLLAGLSHIVHAQEAVEETIDVPTRMPNGASFDPDRATSASRFVEGPGWKIGEDTTIHPVVGIETGAISNVFYTNDSNCRPGSDCVHAAGFLRGLFQIGAGSLNDVRLTSSTQGPEDPVTEQPRSAVADAGSFQYRADVRAAYDQILSTDGTVSDTGGFSFGSTLRGVVHPNGPFSLWLFDDFDRLIRAANFETDANTNRDINSLEVRLAYHPRARFAGYLSYSNTFDVFERSNQQFADRTLNSVDLHPIWQWLPQTRIYADVSQGFNLPIGSSSTKVSSYPTAAGVGIATLLTPLITLNGSVGYTWLNYSSGASTSGVHGGVSLGYRYSEFGRIVLQYNRVYEDSINANFYQEHVIRAWGYHINAPLVFSLQPELHLRDYVGTIVQGSAGQLTRSDAIFQLIAGVSYNLRNSLAIGLDYRFAVDSTDFRYMTNGILMDPSYSRHSFLLGIRAAL
jgi:opacity protein-like surface antigen